MGKRKQSGFGLGLFYNRPKDEDHKIFPKLFKKSKNGPGKEHINKGTNNPVHIRSKRIFTLSTS